MPGPRKPATAAVAPSTFPKKRCKNCPKFFLQTKPWREFCSDECRKEFHRFGSSFGKLKETVAKMITKEAAEIITKEFDRYVSGKDFRRTLAAAGFIHRSQIIKRSPEQRPASLLRRLQNLQGRVQALEHANTTVDEIPGSEASRQIERSPVPNAVAG